MLIQLHMGIMPLNCWNLFKSESVSFEDDVQSKAIINGFQDEYKHGSSVYFVSVVCEPLAHPLEFE